jgi:RNA polymerase sigma-70 factor (ECF subfamily)
MSEPTEGRGDRRINQAPSSGVGTSLSLLEQLRKNDCGAWERLVTLYRPLVGFWCRRAGLSSADSEDVTQEVFAGAARGLDGFRRDRPGDSFRGWLRGITRNQVLLHFRRNRGEPLAEGGSAALNRLSEHPDPVATTVREDEESSELSRLYLRALEQVRDSFEERTWRAFWLVAVEGRAPADLELELQMSSAAIRQAKSRVLRRIKEDLGELLD